MSNFTGDFTISPSNIDFSTINICGNNNQIKLKDNKIFYKNHDITERFIIKLVDSGYLDKLLDNNSDDITDEDRLDCLQAIIKEFQEEEKSTSLEFLKEKPLREQIDDFINEQLGGIKEKHK